MILKSCCGYDPHRQVADDDDFVVVGCVAVVDSIVLNRFVLGCWCSMNLISQCSYKHRCQHYRPLHLPSVFCVYWFCLFDCKRTNSCRCSFFREFCCCCRLCVFCVFVTFSLALYLISFVCVFDRRSKQKQLLQLVKSRKKWKCCATQNHWRK